MSVKKLLMLSLLLFATTSLFGYCPDDYAFMSNASISCVSGMSANPANISAFLWIQGLYNEADNAGTDSTGVPAVDMACLFDGNSVLVDGPCNGDAAGNYLIYADWVNTPFDGCPMAAGTTRAVLLAYDTTGKYILQSRSRSHDWTNWDAIGTTTASVFSAKTGDPHGSYTCWANFTFSPPSNSVKYGTYASGDAPASPIVTGFRAYFNSSTSAPTDFRTSAWTAGEIYPTDTTTANVAYPAGAYWISRSLIIDGKELPFVSTNYSLLWVLYPSPVSVLDHDPCACSGIDICIDGCYEGMDILVDGTNCYQYGSSCGYIYHGTCGVQHVFQVRCSDGGGYYGVSPWSVPVTVTDASATPPSTPVMTSITDNDPNAQTGVTINYTPGTPAYRHDLYRDGYLVQTGFVSGSTFSTLDCNVSHDFTIGAVSDSTACHTTFSTPVSTTDQCVGAPNEMALGATSCDAQVWSSDKTTQSWPPYTGATGFKLYRGTQTDLANLPPGTTNSCKRYDGTNTSIDLSGDIPSAGSFYWYLVTAYNGSGEGPAGTGRIINTSGVCP
jgi:hypothetical protein